MNKLVHIMTTFVFPRKMQGWYRRHPKTYLAGTAVGLVLNVVAVKVAQDLANRA